VALLFLFVSPLVLFHWRRFILPPGLHVKLALLSLVYFLYPVRASESTASTGRDTVGLFHRSLVNIFSSELVVHAVFFLCFLAGLHMLALFVKELVAMIRARNAPFQMLLILLVGTFLLVMPFSYQIWEKYSLPLVPVVVLILSNLSMIQIKRAALEDLALLQAICRKTFFETFASGNTEANMARYAEKNFSIGKMTGELNQAGSEFYFAVLGNRVIGYLKLNVGQAQTDIKEDTALEIERIYVLAEYHGKGVGKLLLDKALAVAKRERSDYVWLGVWERNPRAIQFYKKNGFVEFGKHVFRLGEDEQTDIMMKLQLGGH
jgi:ribosomal protein S18 acetylase RimI-like enzyme